MNGINADGNAVLTDQTIICEASRLLQNTPVGDDFGRYLAASGHLSRHTRNSYQMGQRWWPPTIAERVIHLSLLLQALLLYENVYVLGAELPPDADHLRFRKVLLDQDILRTIDPARHSAPIVAELGQFLGQARERMPTHGGHSLARAEYIKQIVRLALDGAVRDSKDEDFTDPGDEWSIDKGAVTAEILLRELEGTTAHWWLAGRGEDLRADPIETLCQQVMEDIGYFGSGAVLEGVSLLRTFVYWRLSAHANLPFIPSLRRLPAYHLMMNYIRRSTQERVYGAVSASFHATIEEVYDSDRPVPVYLPPALSLFLDRLRSGKTVPETILELREEYRDLRLALSNLQNATNSSATLRHMLKARRNFVKNLESLRGSNDSRNTVDQVLDIIPSVAKAVTNPLDINAYTGELLRRPADWIRAWWRRRPLRPVFALQDQLMGLNQYDNLLEQALHVKLDPGDVMQLVKSYEKCLRVYGGEGVLPNGSR